MKRRMLTPALLAMIASCLAPETMRFYGGYWSTTEIDNRECHARANAPFVVPGGEAAPALVLAPAGSTAVSSSVGGSYKVDIPGIGGFDVAVHMRGSVAVDGVSVPADARIAVAVAPPAFRPRPVPGFVFGVDLRPYRHIVFVVDNTADMCELASPDHRRVVLDDVIDQVIASLSGLSGDPLGGGHQVSLIAASGQLRQLQPMAGDDGRRTAMEWTCGLMCEGDSSMTLALVRAFEEHPDVVVLLSNGAMPPPAHNGRVEVLPDLASVAADPVEAVARMEWTAPVIAVDVGRGLYRDRLLGIANATGGSYVAL